MCLLEVLVQVWIEVEVQILKLANAVLKLCLLSEDALAKNACLL